jgi:hypothetical protein
MLPNARAVCATTLSAAQRRDIRAPVARFDLSAISRAALSN